MTLPKDLEEILEAFDALNNQFTTDDVKEQDIEAPALYTHSYNYLNEIVANQPPTQTTTPLN